MALKHVILTMLQQEGDSTGYDLTKKFDLMWQFFWRASHQQMYRELGKLVEASLVELKVVEQKSKPNKKIYSLNKKGRSVLKDWFASPIVLRKVNDELVVRLLGYELAGVTTIKSRISEQRKMHVEQLNYYLTFEERFLAEYSRESMTPEMRIIYLSLRKGIHEENAWLAWELETQESLSAISENTKPENTKAN